MLPGKMMFFFYFDVWFSIIKNHISMSISSFCAEQPRLLISSGREAYILISTLLSQAELLSAALVKKTIISPFLFC